MTTRPIVLFAGSLLFLAAASSARAGIVTYTDIDEWRAAASQAGTGVVTEIDFETLPDGSPTLFERTPITPEFNYTDQGVTFSSPFPDLFVRDTNSGGRLQAAFPNSSGRNWIIAELGTPVAALGILTGGHTTLFLHDGSGDLVGDVSHGGAGSGLFIGIVSDVAIASSVIDRGASFEILDSFHFTPVPEPAALVLLGFGGLTLLARKRS